MSETLLSSGNLPPVLRRWRGSQGEDAVDYQEEPGDFPYFVDGKHRIQAALRAGISRVPVIDLLQFESPSVNIITRNDKGDVIPLSERFGEHIPGARSNIEGGQMEKQYKFVKECVDGGHGQTDMELGLWVDEGKGFEAKGFISYSIADSDGEPAIHWIVVALAVRREGYATKMVLELQKQYPETQIRWMTVTPQGEALYKSLPKKKVFIPEVVEGQEQLISVRKKLADYQKLYELCEEKRGPLDDLKDWNALHDLEDELSIYEDMADHKIVFDTSICDPGPEETESICIWPDGMVCLREDIEEFGWASDDYAQVEMPLDEDMYEFAQRFIEKQRPDCSPGPR